MKFSYKNYGHGVLRPVIPISIIYKNLFIIFEVLVDSGADSNIFPIELAEILGIDITKGEKNIIAGITGKTQTIYFHYLDLRIGGKLFKNIKVGFLENMGQFGYGVVGQKGFFDIFVVKFDLVEREIELVTRGQNE